MVVIKHNKGRKERAAGRVKILSTSFSPGVGQKVDSKLV